MRDQASGKLDIFCDGGVPGRCELGALAASQISTAVILFIYVLVQVGSVVAGEDDPIAVQLTLASAFTILYIFLCFWLVEEKLISQLRELKPFFAFAEFAFRIFLLVLLFLMPNFVGGWIPDLLPDGSNGPNSVRIGPAESVVIFLALLYLFFLVWDALIFFGAPTGEKRDAIQTTSKSFVGTDFLGLLILGSIAGLRFVDENLAAIALLGFIIFSAWLIFRVGREQIGRTRFTRAFVR